MNGLEYAGQGVLRRDKQQKKRQKSESAYEVGNAPEPRGTTWAQSVRSPAAAFTDSLWTPTQCIFPSVSTVLRVHFERHPSSRLQVVLSTRGLPGDGELSVF